MRTEVDDIPRRTWAPFVGAALAALTAGSLVVFSLIAQKTSLDGFPDRRVTATGSAEDPTPSSIRIAPVDNARTADGEVVADRPATDAPSATALLEIAPPPSPTVAVASLDAVSLEAIAPDTDPGADDAAAVTTAAPTGSFRAEETLLTRRAGGGNYEGDGTAAATEWDARHNGRHTHKSHDVKEHGRERKPKKASKRSKESKKEKPAARNRRAQHRSRGHGHRNSQGAAQHNNQGSRLKPAPARSSRPAPASSNAASNSKAKSSSGSPPAHSNAGGNGKSRGRGHGKR